METLEKQDRADKEKKAEEQATRLAEHQAKMKQAQKKVIPETDWSEEELRMLDKALNKFPQANSHFQLFSSFSRELERGGIK